MHNCTWACDEHPSWSLLCAEGCLRVSSIRIVISGFLVTCEYAKALCKKMV